MTGEMKTKGKGKRGGGWGKDSIKPCRVCDFKDAPLQAVPRLKAESGEGPR